MADEQAVATENPVDAGTVSEAKVEESANPQDARFNKSPEELKKIILDQDRELGRRAEKLSKVDQLSEEVAYLKGQIESRPRFDQGFETRPTEQPAKEETFDFTDPLSAIDKRIESKLSRFQQQQQVTEGKRFALASQAAFEKGKREAYSKEPELFRGIERDIEGNLFAAWRNGAANPETLGDPQTWHIAAVVAREMRGESHMIPRRQPVNSVQSERPSSTKKQDEEEPLSWDDDDRVMMKRWNISPKEAEEAIAAAVEMKRRGDLK